MRGELIARRVIGLDAELGKESAHLHIQSLADVGKVAFQIELNRINPQPTRLAIAGGQLTIPDAARQGETIIRTGQNRVGPKSEGRFRSARIDRALEAQPVLL